MDAEKYGYAWGEDTPDFWHGKCTKAIRELALKTYGVLDTLRATGDSLVEYGAIKLAKR